MKYFVHSPLAVMLLLFSTIELEASPPAIQSLPWSQRVSAAIEKSVDLLERAAAGSASERRCFTCHSQALPVMALAEVQNRGFEVDGKIFQSQLEHTAAHLRRGLKAYREGRGQGGRITTAGYALWTLEAGDWKPDEVTTAVTHYLLESQKDDRRWHHAGSRPPSSGSDFTNTYLALRALSVFGTAGQQPAIDARFSIVREWLEETEATDTEDRVFRFRALPYAGADPELIRTARQQLIETQRPDGGWRQNPKLESDAYATGTVLVALLRDGVNVSQPAIVRGVRFLLNSQLDDGSWHVVSRARPFQPYYETGFPHGKDQFISTSATAWATMALALTLPETPAAVAEPRSPSD